MMVTPTVIATCVHRGYNPGHNVHSDGLHLQMIERHIRTFLAEALRLSEVPTHTSLGLPVMEAEVRLTVEATVEATAVETPLFKAAMAVAVAHHTKAATVAVARHTKAVAVIPILVIDLYVNGNFSWVDH
ncbi:hypothetical protein HID58_046074 [Brassica napus]|uniref:Uncharacterized protein n=3 Tax=Brassica TaxID=3705 RepID=A0ABQ8AVF7_BRANA|nr:hypothetical protein HID58_046074 [Brassica napus]